MDNYSSFHEILDKEIDKLNDKSIEISTIN